MFTHGFFYLLPFAFCLSFLLEYIKGLNCQLDLLDQPASGNGQGSEEKEGEGSEFSSNGSLDQQKRSVMEVHWQNAMQQAIAVARTSNNQGSMPAT